MSARILHLRLDPHALHPTNLAGRLLGILALRRSRARLSDLDPHMLCDIGLTRDQARAEALRPLWDAPSGWRKAD